MSKSNRRVLCIAGLDPSGHAGIITDIRTINSLGLSCCGVITVLTDQTRTSYHSSHPVSSDIIMEQIQHIFEEGQIDSVKIGMLYSAGTAETIIDLIDRYQPPNIVLDPVLVSTTGGELLDPDAINILKEGLIPKIDVLTPNIPEAERITGNKISAIEDMITAGKNIAGLGCRNILIKGGHLEENSIDILVTGNDHYKIRGEYVPDHEFRGTGCVLSSAIAVNLAEGMELQEAVIGAKLFLEKARKDPVFDDAGTAYLNLSGAGSD
ncbi:MAG: bifunctional hydroxymethylpyrimidine kinase/phosphomethylpyrimidine kinase [bacterium]|nr:bifunctional hydroxymethylpyrimidine kinase/phosphomethylpyrimidine kinase [bacterium]